MLFQIPIRQEADLGALVSDRRVQKNEDPLHAPVRDQRSQVVESVSGTRRTARLKQEVVMHGAGDLGDCGFSLDYVFF